MSNIEAKRCPVVRIERVEQHPTAEHLNVNYFSDPELGELQTVSDKKEGGVSRYAAGDLAVFYPHHTVLPADYVKFIGYVDANGEPALDAPKNPCRVRASNFKGVRSMGILVPVKTENDSRICDGWLIVGDYPGHGVVDSSVYVGTDVYPIITSPLNNAW
jgi:hypothetical protein